MIINPTEYERIYKIINSIVISEGVSADVAGILFSFFGAQIIKKHYDLNALPKAGVAAYQLGDHDGAKIIVDEAASFHCWVEVEGWFIDFMAPSYSKFKASTENDVKVDSKMMQKPLSSMSASIDELKQAGDFYLAAQNAVLVDKYSVLKSTPVFGDLADVCSHWYNKPPEAIIDNMVIEDQEGALTSIPLQGELVVGCW